MLVGDPDYSFWFTILCTGSSRSTSKLTRKNVKRKTICTMICMTLRRYCWVDPLLVHRCTMEAFLYCYPGLSCCRCWWPLFISASCRSLSLRGVRASFFPPANTSCKTGNVHDDMSFCLIAIIRARMGYLPSVGIMEAFSCFMTQLGG